MSSDSTPGIVVLDPTAPPRELRHELAARPDELGGSIVGFLWNSKPNGDLLFAKIEALLREKYEITGALHRRKQTASIPAPKEVVAELAARVQVAVVGLLAELIDHRLP
ncbi:MAG: hypothetical protein ACE5Q6_11915, partial [Dehalococcoidia bacterium]